VFAAARDITEREQARKALEASESRHRALMEEAAEGILLANEKGKILEVNPSFCEMFGFRVDEVLGTRVDEYIAEEDLSTRPLPFDEVLAGRTVNMEREARRKDGTLFDLESTAKMLQDGRILFICHDVTNRKQAQEKLRMYQARLKSMATELSLVEERQRHQLAVDLHDRIGQTLAVSKLKLELLKQEVTDARFAEALAEVHSLVSRTLEESRTLLFDLCPPILYELGLEPALEYVLDEFRKDYPDIEAVFEDDGKPKPLEDNVRTILFRAARELLVNVAKHARTRRVKLAVRRLDGEIELTVADDGAGFDTSVLQAGGHPEGGFGLFSIREQLGYLGGYFEITSAPGRGTTATLTAALARKTRKRP
jgi:PAS domain S-box-containing protein